MIETIYVCCFETVRQLTFPNIVCKTYVPIIELIKLNFDQNYLIL